MKTSHTYRELAETLSAIFALLVLALCLQSVVPDQLAAASPAVARDQQQCVLHSAEGDHAHADDSPELPLRLYNFALQYQGGDLQALSPAAFSSLLPEALFTTQVAENSAGISVVFSLPDLHILYRCLRI